MFKPGLLDVISAAKDWRLPVLLATSDIRQRYRRSTLGPFWITISCAVMIACIGLIFGRLFKSPMSEFLPFIAAGLILWGFISSVINEATSVFISSESIIKQLPIPLFSHVIRMVSRNLYIFFHNILIYPIVCLLVHKALGLNVFLVIPGLLLLFLNLLWISLLIGVVCTRYRDMGQIVQSLLQIAFYVTPIIWMPNALNGRSSSLILDPNPVYHLMQLVRAPLMNQQPTFLNWSFSLGLFLVGSLLTITIFNKYRYRIPYWL